MFTSTVMSEMLLALLFVAATLAYIRYLEGPSWGRAMLFAGLVAAAILTKANGWALALVPPIALVLTRRFALIRRWSFWVPAASVAIVCIPWYVLTFPLAVKGWSGRIGRPRSMYLALNYHPRAFLQVAGVLICILALIGIWRHVIKPAFTRPVAPAAATMFALCAAVLLFHGVIAPSREVRHMLPAAPALVWFAAAGISSLAQWIRVPRGVSPGWLATALASLVAALAIAKSWGTPAKHHYGATEIVSFILSQHLPANTALLVSSGCSGEGAVISELAMREQRPGLRVVRATKTLGQESRRALDPRYKTLAEVQAALERQPARLIVLDNRICVPENQRGHHHQLQELVRQHPNRFRPFDPVAGASYFAVYRVMSESEERP